MSNISYINFINNTSTLGVFSVTDIQKIYQSFDTRRLFEWKSKNYIKKLTNRWYQFSNLEKKEELGWWVSNRLRTPSYVSLETAFSYYGFIPEGVFTVTAITTNKTKTIHTDQYHLIYRNLKPDLYFGYKVIRYNNWPIKFAEPEKAILDYLYLNSQLKKIEDLKALRLNKDQILSTIDNKKFARYLSAFNCHALEKRVRILEEVLDVKFK
jgi:predicted transcriptional regulator of viral defense system